MSEADSAPNFSLEQQQAIALANGRARAVAAGSSQNNPIDDIEHAAGAGTIARASLPPDPDVQRQRYAEAFNQPIEDFGIVGDHIIRRIPDGPDKGKYARVEASVRGATGPIDAAERAFAWVAGGTGQAVPAVTSMTAAIPAAIAATPESLGAGTIPAAMAAGAAGASVGEVMRQKLDAALAPKGEEAPMDYGNVAWQGAAGAAGPLGAKVLGAVGSRLAPIIAKGAEGEAAGFHAAMQDSSAPVVQAATEGAGDNVSTKVLALSPAGTAALERQAASHQSEIEQLQQDLASFRAAGAPVDLSLGQKTGSIVAQQKERQLLRDPGTAQDVVDLRKLQNETQLPGAVKHVLNDVSPEMGGEDAIGAFRTGADAVIKAAEKKRADAAAPLYQGAFKANPSMQSPVLDKLMDTPEGKDALKFAVTRMQNRMSKVANPDPELTEQLNDLVARGEAKPSPGGVARGLKLETLDLIKQGLWDSEAALRKQVLTGAARQGQADEVAGIRQAFTKELDRLDTSAAAGPNSLKPEGGLYAQARKTFGDPSEDIDAMKQGGIGFIQRMTGQDRQNIISRVFQGGNLLPEEVGRMREQYAAAGKLADWNAGIRSHIEAKLSAALAPTQGGEVSNVGGKLYQSLFAPASADAKVLRAALGSEGDALMKRWNSLGNVMRAAAHQLGEGSASITDIQADPVLSKLAAGLKMITSPQDIPGVVLDKMVGDQSTAAMQKFAKYALTPEGDKILKALYLQTPSSPKAQSLLAQMLTQAGVVGAVGEAGRGDRRSVEIVDVPGLRRQPSSPAANP